VVGVIVPIHVGDLEGGFENGCFDGHDAYRSSVWQARILSGSQDRAGCRAILVQEHYRMVSTVLKYAAQLAIGFKCQCHDFIVFIQDNPCSPTQIKTPPNCPLSGRELPGFSLPGVSSWSELEWARLRDYLGILTWEMLMSAIGFRPTGMASVPPLIMKLAMPVPLSSILSRKRARMRTNRYASFTLNASTCE
jgi:hypothetical protein